MAETMRSPSSSNWACLPRDLIDSILDRVVLLSDLVLFSAVCKSWNCMALNHYKERRIPQINHQLPWFVIQWGQKRHHSLYDLTTSKICNFQFQIPPIHSRDDDSIKVDYRGSSHGWLFIWDVTALKMYNPISGIMFGIPRFMNNFYFGCESGRPKRVTLSRDPSTCLRSPSPPFEVLACSYPSNVIAHWKSGDKFWSYSKRRKEYKDEFRFHDFIFYKDRMLGIGCRYMNKSVVDVVSISIDNTQTLHHLSSGRIKMKRIASTPRLERGICGEGYLVETTKGDLLIVQKEVVGYRIEDPFKVNKLIIDSNHESANIIPITNLDGESLFLGGNNYSISVLASNYPICIPNSIYYATDGYYFYLDGQFNVFNLEDKSAFKYFLPIPSITLPVTPWIVPSMKLL